MNKELALDKDYAYRRVTRLCDETDAACKAILQHSNLWLWLHPLQARQMRRRMLALRGEMREARDNYMALTRHAKASPDSERAEGQGRLS